MNEFASVVTIESIFLVHLIMQFFVEYEDETGQRTIRNLQLTAINYVKTRFIFDFIPLLPINFIPMYRKREYLFYVVKMTRLYRSLEFFDVHEFMKVVKRVYKSRMQRIIDKNPKLANNIYLDNNKIGEILNISYTLRII